MKILVLATAAVTLAAAPFALAAPGGNGNGHGPAQAKGAGAAHVRTLPVVTATRVEGGWSVNGAGVADQPRRQGHAQGPAPRPGQEDEPPSRGRQRAVAALPRLPGAQPHHPLQAAAGAQRLQYVRVGDDAYLRQSNTGTISRVIENLFR